MRLNPGVLGQEGQNIRLDNQEFINMRIVSFLYDLIPWRGPTGGYRYVDRRSVRIQKEQRLTLCEVEMLGLPWRVVKEGSKKLARESAYTM